MTGKVPTEAMDRLDHDDLVTPSAIGITISPDKEKALLKAMAIKARDRYQKVDDFQKALLEKNTRGKVKPNKATDHTSTNDHHHSFKLEPKSIDRLQKDKNIEKEILIRKHEADFGAEREIVLESDTVCLDCNRTGLKDGITCSTCNGSGRQHSKNAYQVKIPAKVKEGTKVSLKGLGQDGIAGG